MDDSPLTLRLLQRGLSGFDDIELVGTAAAGLDAPGLIARAHPDVICTDLHMPGLDGLGLVRRVMATTPTPIIVVSVAVTADYNDPAGHCFELLRARTVDLFLKPRAGFAEGVSEAYAALARRMRVAADVSVFRRAPGARTTPPASSTGKGTHGRQTLAHPIDTIAIGASTGGPMALMEIDSALPATLPVPLVAVQHIAIGFLDGLVAWLDAEAAIRVEVASPFEAARPGSLHVAPEGSHLALDASHRDVRSDGPQRGGGHRPSVDMLFESVAQQYGPRCLAVLLSGMGRDGATGMGAVRRPGGITVAQDEASSLVFGMPGPATHHSRLIPPTVARTSIQSSPPISSSRQTRGRRE